MRRLSRIACMVHLRSTDYVRQCALAHSAFYGRFLPYNFGGAKQLRRFCPLCQHGISGISIVTWGFSLAMATRCGERIEAVRQNLVPSSGHEFAETIRAAEGHNQNARV